MVAYGVVSHSSQNQRITKKPIILNANAPYFSDHVEIGELHPPSEKSGKPEGNSFKNPNDSKFFSGGVGELLASILGRKLS
jgi:hypothetical protein